jgi:hypothetical protein
MAYHGESWGRIGLRLMWSKRRQWSSSTTLEEQKWLKILVRVDGKTLL